MRGAARSRPEVVLVADVDGAEPDWVSVECGSTFEACEHPAAVHFPHLLGRSRAEGGHLGTRQYLGIDPMSVDDAWGCTLRGLTLHFTDAPGRRVSDGRRNHWERAVTDEVTGGVEWLRVGRFVRKGRVETLEPAAGMQWLFPPTRIEEAATAPDPDITFRQELLVEI
jgi:hypothetical protein